jgi:hypothetical protein
MKLPSYIRRLETVENLARQIYPPELMHHAYRDYGSFRNRAFLVFTNHTLSDFNDMMIDQLSGEAHIFNVVNTIKNDASPIPANHFDVPAEYLQSINIASLPPSGLKLKIGAPVILLRNLCPKEGLCNGTRMIVIQLGRFCVKVKISGGAFDGHERLLSRITLTTTEEDLPFILMRKQFPIRLCFAITVNKSQGQSLDIVGLDLRMNAFTHGQLYVALSRVTSVEGLTILLPEDKKDRTENIVYPEVLL